MIFPSLTELPLFRRELTELAQRRRTYVVRVMGAILLLSAVYFMLPSRGAPGSPGYMAFTGLGSGGAVFHPVVRLMFAMIPILMPALCCTAITAEKEQNTLGTLLLTRLTPGAIVVEKLFSRVVPMLTLLLLVSPVLAYVYSLGGVDTGLMFGSVWLLFCECLLFAALSLFFSAWFATSVAAFVWSYIATAILFVASWAWPVTAWGVWDHELRATMGVVVGPGAGFGPGAVTVTGAGEIFFRLFCGSLIPGVVTMILLLLTRFCLVPRAFLTPSSVLMKVFRRLDDFFTQLNAWTTGGIEIVGDSRALPDDDPVTWRERNKKSLGQFRWLVRVLLALEGPTFFICSAVVITEPNNAFAALYPLLALLWIFAAILMGVKGVSLFAQERSRQTLEALLSTPLTSQELFRQKIRGTNRLLAVLACPILTVNLTQAVLQWHRGMSVLVYVLFSGLLLFLVLRTVCWMTMAAGLWAQSQSRAIMSALSLVATWVLLPCLCLFVVDSLFGPPADSSAGDVPLTAGYAVLWFAYGSSVPGTIAALELWLGGWWTSVGYNVLSVPRGLSAWPLTVRMGMPPVASVLPGLIIQAGLLAVVQRLSLRMAPHLLQRRDQDAERPPAEGAVRYA